MKPPSRSLGVIQRAFDQQYPNGIHILLVGSARCRPIDLHKTMNVSSGSASNDFFLDSKRCYETLSQAREEEGVRVVSTALQRSECTKKFRKDLKQFDALMYMLDAIEESTVARLKGHRELINDLMKGINPVKPTSVIVAILVINTRIQGAKKKTYLCAQLKDLLKAANRKLFVINPNNRLGLLRPIYFLGDQIFLQQREFQRMEWKRERESARSYYDDKKEDQRLQREEKRYTNRQKKKKAKTEFSNQLIREGVSNGDPTWGNSDVDVDEGEDGSGAEVDEDAIGVGGDSTDSSFDTGSDTESEARYSSTDPPSDEA